MNVSVKLSRNVQLQSWLSQTYINCIDLYMWPKLWLWHYRCCYYHRFFKQDRKFIFGAHSGHILKSDEIYLLQITRTSLSSLHAVRGLSQCTDRSGSRIVCRSAVVTNRRPVRDVLADAHLYCMKYALFVKGIFVRIVKWSHFFFWHWRTHTTKWLSYTLLYKWHPNF